MVDDTWTSRELPVLGYLVQRFEDPDVPDIPAKEIAKALDLSPADVARSLRKLSGATPPYLEVIPPAAEVRDPDIVFNVTERARRAVGQWPTADSVADRLVAALQSAADREPDEEKRGWLRRTAAWLGGAGRDFAVEIGAAVVSRQLGGE